MPQFDGTGPAGDGPMTGRGDGPCARKSCMGMGMRRGGGGFGRRGGFGRMRGWCGFGGGVVAPDADALEEMEKALEEELAAVRKERADLKKK